jgi:hypothetical protein
MKRSALCFALLCACGPSEPPVAPVAPLAGADDSSPKKGTPSIEEPPEDAARAFFEAIASGDCKGARGRTITFDEMTKLSKKATDRAEYDAEIAQQIEELCHDYANRDIRVLAAQVLLRKTATVAEAPSKLKIDVELARMGVSYKVDGETLESRPLTFVKVGRVWKYTTKDA